MIKEFRVDNFLSWVNLSFSPHETNLLIGLNNSGKTNLCKALQFLTGTTKYSIDRCAELIGVSKLGLTNFSLNKDTIDFAVRATIPFRGESATYEYILKLRAPTTNRADEAIKVEYEKLTVTCAGFDSVALLENTANLVKLLHEVNYVQDPNVKIYVDTTAPRETTMLHRLYDLETNERANLFKLYLSYWQTYSLSQEALRRSEYASNQNWLQPNGANLASVIYQLKKSNEKYYRKLLSCLQVLEPDIDYINFAGGDNEPNVFMRFEYKSGVSVPAWTASSGTLRFLGLAYVLFVQPTVDFQPFVVIEEPENGLYISLLEKVLEMASDEPNSPQVLFTSHAPYFIDLFDDKLDAVFVAKRDGHISSLSNIDIDTAKQRLSDFSLGEQHFREMLT